MKSYLVLAILLFFMIFMNDGSALAHSGNTDRNGGHRCHTCGDGSYHYHNAGSMRPVVIDSELDNSHYYSNPEGKYDFSDVIRYPFDLTYMEYLALLGLVALILFGISIIVFWKSGWSLSRMEKGKKLVFLLGFSILLLAVQAFTLPQVPVEIKDDFLDDSTGTYFALQDLEKPNEVSQNPYVPLKEPLEPKANVVKQYFENYEYSDLTSKEQDIYYHLNHMKKAMNIRLQDNNDMTSYEKYFTHKKQVVGLLGLTFTNGSEDSDEIVFEDEYEDYSASNNVVDDGDDLPETDEKVEEGINEEVEESIVSGENISDEEEDAEQDNKVIEESIPAPIEDEVKQQEETVQANPSSSFTLGSTQDEVKQAMGSPDSISHYEALGDIWKYGWSEIQFNTDERVEGWNNYDHNLNVWLGDINEESGPFTLGSSNQQVIYAMGTPDSFNHYESLGDIWQYGNSDVEFNPNNEVKGWSNYDDNLNVSINKTSEQPFFTIGSTKQDVVNVMGTPESVEQYEALGDKWGYGFSKIDFNTDGLVEGWSDSSGNLKVQ